MIPDADQEVAGFGTLEGRGIDQDEAIFGIDSFDDSDDAGDLSLRRLGFARKEVRDGSEQGEDARDKGPLRLGLGRLRMRDSGLGGRRLRSL